MKRLSPFVDAVLVCGIGVLLVVLYLRWSWLTEPADLGTRLEVALSRYQGWTGVKGGFKNPYKVPYPECPTATHMALGYKNGRAYVAYFSDGLVDLVIHVNLSSDVGFDEPPRGYKYGLVWYDGRPEKLTFPSTLGDWRRNQLMEHADELAAAIRAAHRNGEKWPSE